MGEASASFYLGDPRLAALAAAPEPVWLWSPDGSAVIWSNAGGALIFNAPDVDALRARRFDENNQPARQIRQLAASLPADGKPRLESLAAFGLGSLLRPLVCACSRTVLKDNTPAILVCGLEPVRPLPDIAERLRRLFGNTSEALAAFTVAGDLVHATPAAAQRLKSARHIAAIGATALAVSTMTEGRAAGATSIGEAVLWRIGRDPETLVVASFAVTSSTEEAVKSPPLTSPPSGPTAQTSDVVTTPVQEPTPPAKTVEPEKSAPAVARRHPLRFVWHLDADQNFTIASEEFIGLAGPATQLKNGSPWTEFCRALGLDPAQQVATAVATRDTWSGIVLSWPTAGGEPIRVELSGLPIFDRQRQFTGYRGFGVCRDLAQIERIVQRRRSERVQMGFIQPAHLQPSPPDPPRPLLSVVPASPNVVPFPAAPPGLEARTPALNAGDRKAFSDIAQQLAARLRHSARAEGIRDGKMPPVMPRAGTGIDGRAPPPADAEDKSAGASGGLMPGAAARVLIDHLPLGILIYRGNDLLHANRAFLDRVGHATLEEFGKSGGLDNLLLGSAAGPNADNRSQPVSIHASGREPVEVDARLIAIPFEGQPAQALVLNGHAPTERASIRDGTQDRSAERLLEQQIGDLRRLADKTAADHAEFLKRIGHDMRTPLTAIVGFAEAIMSEDFGPIGNERYRDYLSAIRNAGERILALVSELDRQPKSEEPAVKPAAQKETNVDLNAIVQSCVTELQPEASRERVLIRMSLARPLPAVAADVNAVRQIVLSLMTNSIRLAGAGGQVIISTAVSGAGMVSLRLRDTGIGVNESDVAAALRNATASGEGADATEGRLKLAVAKALVEANRASLRISSRPNDGTLVEVSFREMTPPAA